MQARLIELEKTHRMVLELQKIQADDDTRIIKSLRQKIAATEVSHKLIVAQLQSKLSETQDELRDLKLKHVAATVKIQELTAATETPKVEVAESSASSNTLPMLFSPRAYNHTKQVPPKASQNRSSLPLLSSATPPNFSPSRPPLYRSSTGSKS